MLVYCALGYSRSASAVASWLLLSGTCSTVEQAVSCVRQARPGVVLTPEHVVVLSLLAAEESAADSQLTVQHRASSDAENKAEREIKSEA